MGKMLRGCEARAWVSVVASAEAKGTLQKRARECARSVCGRQRSVGKRGKEGGSQRKQCDGSSETCHAQWGE